MAFAPRMVFETDAMFDWRSTVLAIWCARATKDWLVVVLAWQWWDTLNRGQRAWFRLESRFGHPEQLLKNTSVEWNLLQQVGKTGSTHTWCFSPVRSFSGAVLFWGTVYDKFLSLICYYKMTGIIFKHYCFSDCYLDIVTYWIFHYYHEDTALSLWLPVTKRLLCIQ